MDLVVSLIRSTSNAEIVEADANRVCFHGQSPRRTFQIIREGVDRFRVKETTGWPTAGRSSQPSAYSDRDIITEDQMIGWVSARLNELQAV
jgi:hypothetical protein